jgi:DNA-binding response OmpR family regulator
MTQRAMQRIFVVERDAHVRELLLLFLESPLYTLTFFDDGEAALAEIRARRPDLVILEILVPRLDGLGLCRKIKLSPALSDTPVLVLSMLNAHDRAKMAGADAFMLKPLDRRRLLAAVESLLVPRSAAAVAAQEGTHDNDRPRP